MLPMSWGPYTVFTSSIWSRLSYLIGRHEKGFRSHVMWNHRRFQVATQGWLLHEEPLENYLKRGWIVEFWRNHKFDEQPQLREDVLTSIRYGLDSPWYRRVYDLIGLVAQLFEQQERIHSPWHHICSSRVNYDLRMGGDGHPTRLYPSPTDLRKFFFSEPQWELVGVYDSAFPNGK